MISLNLSEKIHQYLENEIAIDQLEEWIVPRLPDFLENFDSTDADMIAAIELGLAEIGNQNWNEEQFRSYLAKALRQTTVLVLESEPSAAQIETGTSSITANLQHMNIPIATVMERSRVSI